MAQCALGQVGHRATFLDHHVVRGVLPLRHVVVWHVGDCAEQVVQFALGVLHGLLQCLVFLLYHGHPGLYLVGFVLLSLLHEVTYAGCHLLGFLLRAVRLLLCFAARLVYGDYLLYCFLGTVEVLFFKSAYHAVCFLSDKFECKHNMEL